MPNDPKGFVGTLQAISGSFEKLPQLREALIRVFATNPQTQRQIHVPLVSSLENSISTEAAKITLRTLKATDSISADLARRIQSAASSNYYIRTNSELVAEANGIAKKFGVVLQPAPETGDDEDPFADQ